ncbi:16S rRNA (guanine(527)-N(7))-methyltransferase RsmG [Halobacteriovorax sp. HLS]|uniref:16S rRNA (guanine(527)-N(7))-methyltransferase RsmG n=1 Tax=Halobacteriovorax sp. HLS TaxID=2234000 RepID=UPI000FD77078|nr:RsmG family class I SAM-dependent methyltransferase [Halobacteriovorax sp. HLS]
MKEFAKRYLDLLTGEYAGINLTRITTFEDFYQKQIVDSVLPLEVSKVFKKELESVNVMVDVGFGGGFPLLPMAAKYPNKTFIGFEARAKKAKVVQEIALKLGLQNVKCYHHRIENVVIDLPAVITFKAVGTLEDFVPKLNYKNDINVFFYKGPSFYELEEVERLEHRWKIVEECFYDLEGTDGRMLIGLKNRKVPRGTKSKKEAKNLVNLSELI